MLFPALFQISVFLIFVFLQNDSPAVTDERREEWFIPLLAVGQIWAAVIASIALAQLEFRDSETIDLSVSICVFYAAYSFVNYWWHRARHRNRLLWGYLHAAHHAPTKMHTLVAWFRNPVEILADILVITGVAFLLNSSAEVVIWGMCIEGALELMHHTNIRTPRRLRWLGYFVQLPEMHRVHHRRGTHSGNYATAFWDWPFGTLVFDWVPARVGLKGGLLAHFTRSKSGGRALTEANTLAHYKGHSRMDECHEPRRRTKERS